MLQALGEYILMQSIDIRTDPQLMTLKRRLFEATYVDRNPMGHIVQDFFFDSDEAWLRTGDVEALMFVVNQMSRLRLFTVMAQGLEATHTLLSCVSTLSASTLTKLQMVVPTGDDGTFPVINSLQNLRILRLYIPVGSWTHSAARPICLPGLKRAYWSCLSDDVRLMIFLSKCKFGEGEDSEFELDGVLLQEDRAQLLVPLFSNHTFTSIKLSIPSQALSLLGSSIVNTRSLLLYNYMPAPGAFPVLPELLTLYYPSAEKQDQEAFWNFLARPLAVLSVEVQRSRSTINIIYHTADQEGFDWLGRRDEDYVVFIGRLLWIAGRLCQYNIIVEDVHGRDVTSLTQYD
jgi:hypothetical protein